MSTGNKSAGVAFVDLAVGDSKALVEGIIRVAETSAQGFSSTFAKSFSGNGISKEIRDSIVLASTKAADEAVSAVNSRLKAAKVAVIDPGEAGRQGRQAGERASNELGESLRSGAKKAGQRAGEDAGNAMNRAFASTVKNIAAGVSIGNAITNSVQSTLGFIKGATFDFNNQLTTANIAFSTMLGNGQKATAFIANLKDFAKNTPFQFEDLVDASQRLLAMGIAAQDILPDLTAIGDAVANLGGGKEKIDRIVLALGQMQAAGHVTGMELRQLTEAGVPALRILADSYGVTTAEMTKMISAGSVDSDRGIKAIVDGLEHGTKSVASFGGAMEKQSHTMQGALSNIKDSLTIALADTAKPMFDDAAKGAEGFVHWLSSPQFAVFARQMQIGANAVGAVVGPLAGMATGLVSVIGPMGTLVVLAEALFARKIASGMGSFSTGITTARTEMAKAALTGGDLNAVQRKLNSEVGSFAGTLGGLSSRVQVATTMQGSLAGGLAAVKGSASLAKAGLSSLVGFLGGPFGIALTAATIGITYFMQQAASRKADIDALQGSLANYAAVFKDGVTPATLDAANAALKNDKELRGLISTTKEMGISQATLIAGLNGDKAARAEIVAAIDKQMAAEKQHNKEYFAAHGSADTASQKRYQALEKERAAYIKANDAAADATLITDNLTKENEKALDPMGRLTTVAGQYAAGLAEVKTRLSQLTAAQDAASQAASAIFAATVDRAEAADKAIIAVTEARNALTDHFRDAQRALAAASRDASETALQGSRAVKAAQESEKASQLSLIEARKSAIQQLKDLRHAARDLGDNEEGARIRLARAQEEVKNTANLPATDLGRREALLGLSEAQHALDDVLAQNAKTRADLAEAERLGVEKNSGVIAANKAVNDAHNATIQAGKDAKRANAEAQAKLTEAQEANTRSLDPATAAGARNLAMVQRMADANKAAYEADLAHGVLPEVAKADYDKRAALDKKELDNLGFKKDAANKLYDSYTAVSGNFTAIISLLGLPEASKAVDDFINKQLKPLAAFFGIDVTSLFGASPEPTTGPGKGQSQNPKLATGGEVPGQYIHSTSDHVQAWLTPREWVQPVAAVDYYGPDVMEGIRTRSIPREMFGQRLASGGMVGHKDLNMGSANLFAGANAAVSDIYKSLGVGGSGDARTGQVQSWLRSIDPLPYVFGAVGPNAFDCSGLVGEVWARLTGHASNSRYFTTATESLFAQTHGFQPGPGAFTIGWNDHHTVGNLSGLNFEAANSVSGIHIGSGASSPLEMPNVMHLAQLGGKFMGQGAGYVDPTSIKLGGAVGAILKKIVSSMTTASGSGGDTGKTASGPTGLLAQWIATAERLTNTPPSWTSGLNTLIQRESGGNPRSINTWDSNAKAGDPSRGLMQTIGATFKQYHQPGTSNDIYDPVANIAAGINYIKHRYGDISKVQQANPNLPPKGYDSGGWLDPGDTGASSVRVRKPEAVLLNDQWSDIKTLAGRAVDPSSAGTPSVRVYIGNEELKGYIEVVADERSSSRDAALARKLLGR